MERKRKEDSWKVSLSVWLSSPAPRQTLEGWVNPGGSARAGGGSVVGHNHLTMDIRPEGSGCTACDAYHRSQREGARATPHDIGELIEKSSLGTERARALRAEGARLLKGVVPKSDKKLARIGDDFTAGRIDEREAYDRCLEAGCTPKAARVHVARWARAPE